MIREGSGVESPQQRARRIIDRLDELFGIGQAAGTNRPGLGPGEQRAHDLVGEWMGAAGLEVQVDRAGNLFGRAVGAEPTRPEVWSGSHLDTPPDGGRFDGALGVLAALEAASAIASPGRASRTIAVVAFRMEEGCRFGRGVFGSRAMLGRLERDEARLTDADGVTLGEAFAALGLGELPSAGWLGTRPEAFVEPHIEQGPTLAEIGVPIGVVSSIAGMAGINLVFTGRRAHAGTVPMALRSDALAAASAFVGRAHDAARALPGCVATVGRMAVSPGATNTIPGRVELFADLRAPDAARLDALVATALAGARDAAEGASCHVEIEPRWRYEPEPMHPVPSAALRRAISALGLEPVELPSGAGHDAAILAAAGIPTAMLFVRSDAGGTSHAPEEATGADAVGACVEALEAAPQALVAAIAAAFIEPGIPVVVPAPTYGLYAHVSAAAGGRVTTVPLKGLEMDLDAVAAAARSERARLVWICDPNNPTGALADPGAWSQFLDELPDDCAVVADEAYIDFAAPELRADRLRDVVDGRPVIVLRSFSKIFGLAGLRLGFAVADPGVARVLDIVQEQFGVNRAALAAGRAAVALPGFIDRRRAEVAAARDALRDALAGGGIVTHPSQANFVLVELGVDDRPVCEALLRRGALVRGGHGFGIDGFCRVTVAPVPVMGRVAELIAEARAAIS